MTVAPDMARVRGVLVAMPVNLTIQGRLNYGVAKKASLSTQPNFQDLARPFSLIFHVSYVPFGSGCLGKPP